jgi:hypothetical protein
MLTTAYLDCPTGIAGDMCLGALVDVGVPLDYVDGQLRKLGIAHEYTLLAETVYRNGQQATKVHVRLTEKSPDDYIAHAHTHEQSHEHLHGNPHDHSHGADSRHLPDIQALIQAADLPSQATDWSLAIFHNLAKAEGSVHGVPPEQVQFHEVGATDAIVDIVGTCLGLDYLGIQTLYCSALPVGGGMIRAAHGRLPVPVPAVLKLWEMRQVPVYSNGIDRELVTPTGAAIATTLAHAFGSPPPMQLHRIGLGAGSRDLPIPNALRLWLGTELDADRSDSPTHHSGSHDHHNHQGDGPPNHPFESLPHSHSDNNPLTESTIPKDGDVPSPHVEQITVLETQVDDLTPQAIGYVFDVLFKAGALDVFTQAVGMKKSRPGVLITVICHPDDVPACEAVIFQETTTLGIRRSEQARSVLHREITAVDTPFGAVRLKVARRSPHSRILNVHPEYEDCARIARESGLPWLTIHRAALQSWHFAKNP